jgi:hypothetical protein
VELGRRTGQDLDRVPGLSRFSQLRDQPPLRDVRELLRRIGESGARFRIERDGSADSHHSPLVCLIMSARVGATAPTAPNAPWRSRPCSARGRPRNRTRVADPLPTPSQARRQRRRGRDAAQPPDPAPLPIIAPTRGATADPLAPGVQTGSVMSSSPSTSPTTPPGLLSGNLLRTDVLSAHAVRRCLIVLTAAATPQPDRRCRAQCARARVPPPPSLRPLAAGAASLAQRLPTIFRRTPQQTCAHLACPGSGCGGQGWLAGRRRSLPPRSRSPTAGSWWSFPSYGYRRATGGVPQRPPRPTRLHLAP